MVRFLKEPLEPLFATLLPYFMQRERLLDIINDYSSHTNHLSTRDTTVIFSVRESDISLMKTADGLEAVPSYQKSTARLLKCKIGN